MAQLAGEVPSTAPEGRSNPTSAVTPGAGNALFAQLSKNKNWAQRLIDEFADFVYVLSPTGVIVYASPSSTRVVGFTPDELFGRNLGEFVHPEDVPKTEACIKGSALGMTDYNVVHRFRKSGSDYVILEVRGRPLTPANTRNGSQSTTTGHDPVFEPVVPATDQSGNANVYMLNVARENSCDMSAMMDDIIGLKFRHEQLKKEAESTRRINQFDRMQVTSISDNATSPLSAGNSRRTSVKTPFTSATEPVGLPLNSTAGLLAGSADSSTATLSDAIVGTAPGNDKAPPGASAGNNASYDYASLSHPMSRLQTSSLASAASPNPSISASAVEMTPGLTGNPNTAFGSLDQGDVSFPFVPNGVPTPEYYQRLKESIAFINEAANAGVGPVVGGISPTTGVPQSSTAAQLQVAVQAQLEAEKHRKKRRASGRKEGEHVCIDCGTTQSPEWRKGPTGAKTLCNACGLRYAKRRKQEASGGPVGANAAGTVAK